MADGKLLDIKSLVLTLLSGPILWGARIASREISMNGRMRDEYRYKASLAMALEGYKREAGEVDSSLVLKLMAGAVQHFAENPALRVHKIENANPASLGRSSRFRDCDSLCSRCHNLRSSRGLVLRSMHYFFLSGFAKAKGCAVTEPPGPPVRPP